MGSDLVLLGVSFVVIIVGAELFTNGVEWLESSGGLWVGCLRPRGGRSVGTTHHPGRH